MKAKPLYFSLFFIFLIQSSCNKEVKRDLQNGMWRGYLINEFNQEIPFNFQVINNKNETSILIFNSNDTIKIDDVKTSNDSMNWVMPYFDSEFMIAVKDDSLVGRWTKHYPNKILNMPFKAKYNEHYRFIEKHEPTNDINGTWDSQFISSDKKDTSIAIADLKNTHDKLIGTFLSTTGDYRFLEGNISSNKINLSTFDGSHVYLFTAELSGDKIINGKFYSGPKSLETWTANFNPNAQLANVDSLTFLKPGIQKINFAFPDLENNIVSLSDKAYQNKVVILQIMGSWCPNCLDESKYLTNIFKTYEKRDLSIIGLCYERSDDVKIASKNILNFKKRIGIKYPLLIAGTNQKGKVNESLPMLKNFIAFPTLIIIDKKGIVRKIHTGYSGPATGKFYEEFQKEFIHTIEKYLNESN